MFDSCLRCLYILFCFVLFRFQLSFHFRAVIFSWFKLHKKTFWIVIYILCELKCTHFTHSQLQRSILIYIDSLFITAIQLRDLMMFIERMKAIPVHLYIIRWQQSLNLPLHTPQWLLMVCYYYFCFCSAKPQIGFISQSKLL